MSDFYAPQRRSTGWIFAAVIFVLVVLYFVLSIATRPMGQTTGVRPDGTSAVIRTEPIPVEPTPVGSD
ncbi:hypothetical protein [Albibacillus kandeliae]|jgi:hypothetical protein|uniref:hypothetical protein n=1 Tax=Albibacillus kandeliae TaxID=2174228 RepID=UPI000D68F8DE|nr:hypothetical protein [Albibacillus kandeliae]